MKAAQAGAAEYDKRIRRAEHLASLYPFAAEILRFYAHLAEFQKELCARLPREWGNQPLARPGGHLRSELNLVLLLPHFPTLLDVVERAGPVPLADAARQFAARAKSQWIAALGDFWSLGGLPDPELSRGAGGSEGSLTEVLLRAFLQPYCEFLAARMPAPAAQATSDRVCPRCGSAPLLGVLRPEGDGAKRLLMCSFCLQEWDFRRILCAACGEEDEKRLPVYVAEQFPHIRVESCDTCNFYLRTVDLTRDGNAVPIVDDLAAIPLSLWALEHGYTRIQDNLLGA
jgi:formate dehydrogenase maturation protein FdhE